MAKMRVYDLAKELGIESKQIIETLNTTEYDVKAAYFSSYPEGTYSTVLILDKEGNLQRDEEDTVTFGEEELKESLSGFVLEV